jgi:tRNA threonylcarbamoyladenosine biosynthesis protein TsaE
VSLTIVSTSEAETATWGARLAEALEPGTVVALVGHLGAGKTRLVQAVARAAGVDPREVSSPTFVLVQEYAGSWPIYHFDTYRLKGAEDFLDLGAEEYLRGDGVCFVEWADRVAAVLHEDLRIELTATGETTRQLVVFPKTPRGERIVAKLAQTGGDVG